MPVHLWNISASHDITLESFHPEIRLPPAKSLAHWGVVAFRTHSITAISCHTTDIVVLLKDPAWFLHFQTSPLSKSSKQPPMLSVLVVNEGLAMLLELADLCFPFSTPVQVLPVDPSLLFHLPEDPSTPDIWMSSPGISGVDMCTGAHTHSNRWDCLQTWPPWHPLLL